MTDPRDEVIKRLMEALQYAEWAGDRIADCITANIDRQHEKIADAISLGKEVSARARGALQEQLK